jgi:hypothetical protein
MRWQRATPVLAPVLAMVGAMLMTVSALAQSADELVPLIQQNIEDIQLELRLDPARAEENLARQRERLDVVRREAPDHPMLSSLERRIDELEEEIAAQGAQPQAAGVEEQFVPLSVPADVRMQLRDVEQLQTQGDREMMRGRLDTAAQYLDESAGLIDTIEDQYGDQIPPGYAALIVAKERLSALRDQLDRQQSN